MIARIARRRAAVAALLAAPFALGPFGCQEPPADSETARRVIGPRGGTITSLDGVLTIAIPPGALDDDVELFIERTEEPPPVFGQAYLVRPNPALRYDVSVSYHQELPDDASGLAVGAVDPIAFEEGRGEWLPLPILRIDRRAALVSGLDDGLSIFYALLDANDGAASPGSSDTGTSDSGPPPTTGPDDTTTGAPDDTTAGPDDTTGASDDGTSGSTGPGESTGEPGPSFAREVEPILMASCGCHYEGAPAELSFVDAYANLVDVASTQAAGLARVEPGSPDDSYLWHKLSGTQLDVGGSGNPMPAPVGGLDATSLATIEAWISGGAAP